MSRHLITGITGGVPGRRFLMAIVALASLSLAAGPALAGITGPAADQPGILSTIAGGVGGPEQVTGVGISPCGTSSLLIGCGMTFAGGNLYFTDAGLRERMGLVREVNEHSGILSTPAGCACSSGDSGPATSTQVFRPRDVSADAAGNLLIADWAAVQVVAAASGTFYGQTMTAGDIYTVAGGGTSLQDGVPASSASIFPVGVAADHAGNIVIADYTHLTTQHPAPTDGAVRIVAVRTGQFYGRAMTAGDIYTVAGGGASYQDGVLATKTRLIPNGLTVDAAGNLLLADIYSGRVRVLAARTGRFYGRAMTAGRIYSIAGGGTSLRDGGPASQASLDPYAITIDPDGNIVVADFEHGKIRVISVKSGRFYGRAMIAGDIYTVAGGGASLRDGAVATSARLSRPRALALDSAGNIVVAGNYAHRIRVVAVTTGTFYRVHMSAGHIYAIAGTGQAWGSGAGGPATEAEISPQAATYDGGSLAFVNENAELTREPGQTICLVPATSGTYFGQPLLADHVYTIAGTGKLGFSGDGGPATQAELTDPGSLAADAAGNLVVADTYNYRIRVVAAHTGTFYGIAMKTGHIYTIAGDGSDAYSGDGGPALQAGIQPYGGIVIDPDGNVVTEANVRIRVVAAHTGTFYGQAMTAGHVYRIAGGPTVGPSGDGGPAIDALIGAERGIGLDGTDGVLISDKWRIRMIATASGTFYGVPMTAGDIYTVAGDGSFGITGDGGPALDAAITNETVTADSAGNLVFSDEFASRVRVVPATSGTFYGIPMTAGDLYTIAGGGTGGLGDGGPGTQATISTPASVAASGQGVVFVDGLRIRLVGS